MDDRSEQPGTPDETEREQGGEGGYGGGSTGFDEPPAQGLGEGTSTDMSDEEIEEQPRGA